MIRTLKVLSLLLAYPSGEIAAAAPSFSAVLDEEGLVPEGRRGPLRRLASQLAGRGLYDLEERYVLLFDRTRALSLHLFEHVHGESRDRVHQHFSPKHTDYDIAVWFNGLMG